METLVLYLALGLGSGAIYASLALGLIIINRGTNVIHFGYAAMMMMSTLIYGGLRNDGNYIVPLPGVPSIPISHGSTGTGLAALLAISTTIVLAALSHLLVFRTLRHAPVLARIAAAVGIMVLLQALAIMHYGSVSVAPPGVLPTNILKLYGARVSADRFYLAAIVIVIAIALWAFFRFTTVGLGLRACAENERGATLSGWSPGRLALLAWLLAGLFAGGMGVLAAPIVSVDPATYALLIVPALGVALIGRFRSFTLCVVGGLALGMGQSALQHYAAQVKWVPTVGVQDGLPFIVIIIVLALGGRILSTRGAVKEGTAPGRVRTEAGRHPTADPRDRGGRDPVHPARWSALCLDHEHDRRRPRPVGCRRHRICRDAVFGSVGVRRCVRVDAVQVRAQPRHSVPDRATVGCAVRDGRRRHHWPSRVALPGCESGDHHSRGQ